MNIKYEKIKREYDKQISLDTNKKNILILGCGNTKNERCNIIKPSSKENAMFLYGEDSDLYNAYIDAFDIIKNYSNIYTVNCYTTDDFINITKKIVQYDFNYIVPININFRDTFYNSEYNVEQYYSTYMLDSLYRTGSLSTIIMTDKHALLYEDIDHYISEQSSILYDYINFVDNVNIIQYAGANLVYSLNMLDNVNYSNVVLAAMLSINDSSKYLEPINKNPVFDFDNNDLPNYCNFVYFKYNNILSSTNAENLINFRLKEDIYKNVLIDELIKKIIRILDFNDFKGKIYTKYTKLQIRTKIINLLKPYDKKIFKSYVLKDIRFVKSNINTGYIYIELSITPYDSFEQLNVIMEV